MSASTMRAVRAETLGGPDVLTCVSIPRPDLAPDGVLIRVAFAGLIYADAEARRGTYYRKTTLPFYPGREAAGVVEAVGSAVADFKPGDRVAALVMGAGCYADYVQARTAPHATDAGTPLKPSDIVRLPDHVSFTQALVYLINYRLAHIAFHAWAKVPAHEAVLIRGAAGGMGCMLLEIAARAGHPTAAIVRGAEEAAFCQALGASLVVDRRSADEKTALAQAGLLGNIGTAFNGVGGETLADDIAALAPFGQTIAYGYVGGKTSFDLFSVEKTLSIRTFNADAFLGAEPFAQATRAMHARFGDADLQDVGAVFPLAEAHKAHALLEQGGFRGKIALSTHAPSAPA